MLFTLELKTFVNKVYTRLLIVSLISAFTDILTAYTCSFCTKDQIVVNYIANIIHFLVQNAVPCLYTLFAYALIYETEKIGKTATYIHDNASEEETSRWCALFNSHGVTVRVSK